MAMLAAALSSAAIFSRRHLSLSCRASGATTDASEFCDSALDNQIARAAALQTTAPTALWVRLDHQLTNFVIWLPTVLVIWLPTVTSSETDLISARIGKYQYNPVWGALLDQLWGR